MLISAYLCQAYPIWQLRRFSRRSFFTISSLGRSTITQPPSPSLKKRQERNFDLHHPQGAACERRSSGRIDPESSHCVTFVFIRGKSRENRLLQFGFCNSSQNRYFFGVCASAAIYKKYPEVGAYNSPWIKSYEHRSKNVFFVAHLHDSHAFFQMQLKRTYTPQLMPPPCVSASRTIQRLSDLS